MKVTGLKRVMSQNTESSKCKLKQVNIYVGKKNYPLVARDDTSLNWQNIYVVR